MSKAGVPTRLALLLLSQGPLFLAVGFLQVVLTAWLPTVGFSSLQVGLLVSLEGIVAIVLAIPAGVLSDVYGRRFLLVSASFLGAVGLLIIGLDLSFYPLVIASVLLGYSEGATVATWNALLADMSGLENRNRVFSLSYVMINVATGVGLALPGAFPFMETSLSLGSYFLHRTSLILLGGVSFLSPAMAAAVLVGHKETHNPSRRWAGLKNASTLAKLSFFGSAIGFGAGFIIPLIGTWFLFRFGVGDSFSGPLLAVSNILIGLSAFASPRLATRYGQLRAILLTAGSSMVFMLAMAFLPGVWIAAVFYMVRSALMNMSNPLVDSFSMSIFPAEQRGLVSGMTQIAFRFPNSISTYFGGYLLGEGMLELPFLIASACYIIGLAGFYEFFVAKNRFSVSTSIST